MAIETVNHWPVPASVPPKESALQRELVSRIPSHRQQDQGIHGNRIEVEPATHWEKGTFIDTYI